MAPLIVGKNDIAINLLEQFKIHGLTPICGYFATGTYCAGLVVDSVADAFRLGAIIKYDGALTVDGYLKTNSKILAFVDAKVSLG